MASHLDIYDFPHDEVAQDLEDHRSDDHVLPVRIFGHRRKIIRGHKIQQQIS